VSYQIYWGDIHNHCAISYGHGSLSRALKLARAQLDFCSVTGHAFWPDMPTDRDRYGDIIDYHSEGFERLARGWPDVQSTMRAHDRPGEFVPFLSYEWHSRESGDHHILCRELDAPLVGAESISHLRSRLATLEGEGRPALLIPHHIGYPRGYRGINWDQFDEALSPFVEIYSLHGCSESDLAPYPMLHTMGPRDYESTAEYGLVSGRRFGLAASTDHHAGYPGSYGYGRVGVYARDLTREALWEAFRARRVYAVTGDKIEAVLRVDDAWPGEVVTDHSNGGRRIEVAVTGVDYLDRIEVLKNNRPIKRLLVEPTPVDLDGGRPLRAKVRVEWGWGSPHETVSWECDLAVGGALRGVETCFSGEAVVRPREALDPKAALDEEESIPHELLERSDNGCRWRSVTTGNATVRHSSTQSIVVDVEMLPDAELSLRLNGRTFRHTLRELFEGSRGHYLRGWLSEAVRIHRAVPESGYIASLSLIDQPENETDRYYLRVFQVNGQVAWVSPIWVTR
jgi:hypothetical protein